MIHCILSVPFVQKSKKKFVVIDFKSLWGRAEKKQKITEQGNVRSSGSPSTQQQAHFVEPENAPSTEPEAAIHEGEDGGGILNDETDDV